MFEHRPQKRPPHRFDLRRRPFEERHADFSGASSDRHPQAKIVVSESVAFPAVLRTFGADIGTGGEHVDSDPVEADLEWMRLTESDDAVVVSGQPDLDLVLAVARKDMRDQRAATRTEGEAVEVMRLRQLGRHPIHLGRDRG